MGRTTTQRGGRPTGGPPPEADTPPDADTPPAADAARRRSLSLRARLLALLLLVTVVVLVLTGVVTTTLLRGFLVDRADQQLADVSNYLRGPVGGQLADGDQQRRPPPFDGDHDGDVTRGVLAYALSDDGTSAQVVTGTYAGSTVTTASTLGQLKAIPAGRTTQVDGFAGASGSYRVQASTLGDGRRLVVGLPLSGITDTLHTLLLIEVAVGAGVLLVVGAGGFGLVRVALAPLARMTATTRRIAEADLSGPAATGGLRASDVTPGTEVGELGRGMNHMLEQIDDAFAERDQAERRLRQFVADASHELRTPLATIRGYAELSARGVPAGQESELGTALVRIESEAARMGVLVDDLLLLARLDQGRPLERAEVDLCRLALDAAADLRVRSDEHPVRLDLPGEPLVVTGDEHRLRQVLTNLLANAAAHTPAGTSVTTAVRAVHGRAELAVTDDGPGIPVDRQARVFDRFYRADPSRGRATGGSGLGLSIVQAVVAAHGGAVTLTSQPGATTVTVALPLVAAGPAGAGAASPPYAG